MKSSTEKNIEIILVILWTIVFIVSYILCLVLHYNLEHFVVITMVTTIGILSIYVLLFC